MKPSELLNDKEETRELLCGQRTKQLKNQHVTGRKKNKRIQFRDNK